METWSSHQLVQQAEKPLGQEKADDLARYAQRLISRDVAVVFNLPHLAKIVGVKCEVLRDTVGRKRESSNYTMYAIRKRSGGRRFIHSVSADLFKVQQLMDRGDVCRQVLGRIRLAGFRENSKKMRIAGPGSKKVVLGLLVDSPTPRISKETYRRIDRLLHACRKYGVTATATHEGFDSAYGFYNHLSGLIAFVKDVDPVRSQDFMLRFEKISTPWKQLDA
jgi:hypothetical protein